eukprot:SAG22_NODE_4130_length_1374_cov_1.938039_2_plen_87_part_00
MITAFKSMTDVLGHRDHVPERNHLFPVLHSFADVAGRPEFLVANVALLLLHRDTLWGVKLQLEWQAMCFVDEDRVDALVPVARPPR